jgi:PKD repeat protein
MVLINKPIKFTDTSIGTVSTSWNFGDGTPSVNGKNVSHTYKKIGTFRATDTITSSTGDIKTCFQDIVVSNPPPTSPVAVLGFSIAAGLTLLGTYFISKVK